MEHDSTNADHENAPSGSCAENAQSVGTVASVLLLLATLIAAGLMFALCAFQAGFGNGMGAMLMIPVVVISTWIAVSIIVCRRWGRRGAAKAFFIVFALPCTIVFFVVEYSVLAYAIEHVLPRPLFHNRFVYHERAFLPYWYPSTSVRDSFGQHAEADYKENLVVVALTGRHGAMAGIWGSGRGLFVQLDCSDKSTRRTYPRATDALVVVRPDGVAESFPLSAGQARQFHEGTDHKCHSNVLRDAAALLDAEHQAAITQFLSGYGEPIPPRPLFCLEHTSDVPPRAPYWIVPDPVRDQAGSWLWMDHEANLLALVVKVWPSEGRDPVRLHTMDHGSDVSFYIRPGDRLNVVSVASMQDTLIVMRRNGSRQDFPLAKGRSRQFHELLEEGTSADLSEALAAFLSEQDRAAFDAFVTQ